MKSAWCTKIRNVHLLILVAALICECLYLLLLRSVRPTGWDVRIYRLAGPGDNVEVCFNFSPGIALLPGLAALMAVLLSYGLAVLRSETISLRALATRTFWLTLAYFIAVDPLLIADGISAVTRVELLRFAFWYGEVWDPFLPFENFLWRLSWFAGPLVLWAIMESLTATLRESGCTEPPSVASDKFRYRMRFHPVVWSSAVLTAHLYGIVGAGFRDPYLPLRTPPTSLKPLLAVPIVAALIAGWLCRSTCMPHSLARLPAFGRLTLTLTLLFTVVDYGLGSLAVPRLIASVPSVESCLLYVPPFLTFVTRAGLALLCIQWSVKPPVGAHGVLRVS